MKNAAVYIRVSTEDQTEFSPDAQLREIRKYAEKNNLIIKEENIFKDEGISGRRADKRPAFLKMICRAKSKPKPFDVILVHKFDRFARSREDSIVYKSLLRKDCNIKVISITEHMEDDKFSVILEAMLEAMAEYYSLNLSEEVKKGMTEKARRGELQTPAPFGYKMVNGVLTPEDDEAELVKQIFRKYVKEGQNLRTIAKYVNSLGYRTKKGNVFDTRLIEYIIYNPTYIGKMRWTPTGSVVCKHDFDNPDTFVIKGKHKAIVDENLWKEANNLIRSRKKYKIPGGHGDEITTHWLRGLIKCSACGTTLSFGKGRNGRQGAYRCNKYLTGGCSEPQRITESKIEEAVLGALQEDSSFLNNQDYYKQDKELENIKTEPENYSKRAEKLKLQLSKAKELVLSGIDSPEEYKENKATILAQIEEINEKISLLQAKKANAVTQPNKKIKSVLDILTGEGSLTEKNNAVKQIIRKIVYNKKENVIELYYLNVDLTII